MSWTHNKWISVIPYQSRNMAKLTWTTFPQERYPTFHCTKGEGTTREVSVIDDDNGGDQLCEKTNCFKTATGLNLVNSEIIQKKINSSIPWCSMPKILGPTTSASSQPAGETSSAFDLRYLLTRIVLSTEFWAMNKSRQLSGCSRIQIAVNGVSGEATFWMSVY